jgi:hypothetical protein
MLKSAIISSIVLFGTATPLSVPPQYTPSNAEQTALSLPEVETVVAQFAYLEISHDETGFGFSITDESAVFLDIDFPPNLRVRVGF